MSPLRRYRGPTGALAAVLGGAITRERLLRSASREGCSGSSLVRSLLAQSLPSIDDLARAYRESGGALRLDASFLKPAPKTRRLVDAALLRRERCLPVEILDDLVILAVDGARAALAVEAIRRALGREVLPVLADPDAIDHALAGLEAPPGAIRQGPVARRDSTAHARFRDLILDDAALDALPLQEGYP